jgi:hypothetical protein
MATPGTRTPCLAQAGAYDTADVDFLQQVANQVAVENGLAFDEIEALKDKLHQEKVYLEEEVRTEHNFGEIVGESAALRRVLKQVEAVARIDHGFVVPNLDVVSVRLGDGNRHPKDFEQDLARKVLAAVSK